MSVVRVHPGASVSKRVLGVLTKRSHGVRASMRATRYRFEGLRRRAPARILGRMPLAHLRFDINGDVPLSRAFEVMDDEARAMSVPLHLPGRVRGALAVG